MKGSEIEHCYDWHELFVTLLLWLTRGIKQFVTLLSFNVEPLFWECSIWIWIYWKYVNGREENQIFEFPNHIFEIFNHIFEYLKITEICNWRSIFLFLQPLQDRNGVRKPFLHRVGQNIQLSTCLEKSYEDRYWVILTHVSTMKIVDNGSIIELFSQSPFSQLSFSESSFNNFKCSSLFSTSS